MQENKMNILVKILFGIDTHTHIYIYIYIKTKILYSVLIAF